MKVAVNPTTKVYYDAFGTLLKNKSVSSQHLIDEYLKFD